MKLAIMTRLQQSMIALGVFCMATLLMGGYHVADTYQSSHALEGAMSAATERAGEAPAESCVVSMLSGKSLSPAYALGSLVLAHSFRVHTKLRPRPKLVLIHDGHVASEIVNSQRNATLIDMIEETGIWDEVIEMPAPQGIEGSPVHKEFAPLLFKLNAWRLEKRCKRILWIGTDSIVVGNIDNLFSSPAIPAGVPDMFIWKTFWLSSAVNGDFFLFEPSLNEFKKLMTIVSTSSWEDLAHVQGAGPVDQGIINKNYNYDMYVLPWFYSVEPLGIVEHFYRDRRTGTAVSKIYSKNTREPIPKLFLDIVAAQLNMTGSVLLDGSWNGDSPFTGEDWLTLEEKRALMVDSQLRIGLDM
eukprot:jgi/Bigna1/135693/aug1.30_g10401